MHDNGLHIFLQLDHHVVKPATSEVTGGLKLTSGKHIISSNH